LKPLMANCHFRHQCQINFGHSSGSDRPGNETY
jgi:hypothetical protein